MCPLLSRWARVRRGWRRIEAATNDAVPAVCLSKGLCRLNWCMSGRAKSFVVLFWLAVAGSTTAPDALARSREITVTNWVCIRPGLKWNPVFWFKNLDHPTPPDYYRPNDPHRIRKWHFRNPFNNFTYYVIGIADKTFRR